MTLDGKVAIVTGAGTGIGQGISRAFAKAGAKVVVDYVGKASIAQQTLDEIQNAGGTAMGFDADISNQDDVNALIAKTVETYGKVDIFVNNAGIEKKFDFVDYPLDEWQKIMAVNLTGPFLCSQAAARQMIKQGNGGRIINISSVHEDLPLLTNAPYCASKGGLRMLMRTIAVELAKHKITVNNIGPGAIYTPIDADVEADKTMNDAILAEIPLGRWGRPDEIGNMALYLASDDASYITGSTFFVDGGMLRNAGSL
jgi:glucose 1-dehydrogenase